MIYAFRVGDRVIVTPESLTRSGDSGIIEYIRGDSAIVAFDDGDEMGYRLDEGELIIQETMPALVTAAKEEKHVC